MCDGIVRRITRSAIGVTIIGGVGCAIIIVVLSQYLRRERVCGKRERIISNFCF
jgi:hypothetical protein